MGGKGVILTNLLVTFIYASLMLINLILLASSTARKNKGPIHYTYLIVLTLSTLWLFIGIVISVVHDPFLIRYLYTAQLAVLAFIPPTLFILVVFFYKLQQLIPRWLTTTFFAGAALLAVLAIAGPTQAIFWNGEVKVVELAPLVQVDVSPSMLLLVCLFLMQLPMVGVAFIVFSQHKRLPNAYRLSSTILLWCLTLYAAAIVINAMNLADGMGLSALLIGTCAVNLMLYLAVGNTNRTDYLNVWQGEIYDYLDDAIIILDESRTVIDANEAAKQLFNTLEIDIEKLHYDDLWQAARLTGRAFVRSLENEDQTALSQDLYLTDGEYPKVFEIKCRPIESSQVVYAGEFLILTEVTRNRLYIERLQDLAGIDPLTGLPNRFRYEQLLNECDCQESLPLSIILGDVNGLKKLNDEQGHQAGDALLREMSMILKQCCSSKGEVARIGGDEFAILLKNHSEHDAKRLIHKIEATIKEKEDFSELVSIALGSATKHVPEENMNTLYIEADMRMYESKRAKAAVA